ncbi:hypothetical protein [Nocardia sp. NPDC051981]|uniref:hypothetical protein n=1 Tax=Nocardia sp. NPDC051981 TaxID=3155417 RepID=UPI00342020D0
MCAELGAYLPTPRNLAGLMTGVGEGSAVLLGRCWAWIRGAEGWDSDSAMRAGGVALVAYAVGRSVFASLGIYTGYVIPPAIVSWCLVARQHTELAVAVRTATQEAKDAERERLLAEAREDVAKKAKAAAEARIKAAAERRRAGTDAAEATGGEDQATEPIEEDQDEEVEDDELTLDDIAAVVRRVAARHPHHLGVHLSDLLPEPELEGWEQADLKTALKDVWLLPVTSFKLTFPKAPARTRDGVRLEHLPAAPETPAGPVGGRPPEKAPQGVPAGAGEGLALVPSQHPAGAPSGARPEAPASTPPGAAGGAPLDPSPTAALAPSQGTR